MRRFAIALFTAILIAGQFFTPVAAAAPSAWQASASCGDTYTVHRGDWLAKIARYCGTTLANILALNPQIYNPNWIYAGEVLRLTGSPEQPKWQAYPRGWNIHPRGPTRYARVSLSTTRAGVGDNVTVYVSGFPANSDIDFRIGRKGKSYSDAYDGKTKSNGTASKTITIPSNADEGDYWVVRVLTTEMVHGVDIYSPTIYITD
jgi:LysM repeat protein